MEQPVDSAAAEDSQDDNRAVARHVLGKIDRALLPLLFVTYMLNFMDKTILSSAAVFGLREDTVSRPVPAHSTSMLISLEAPARATV